jgi:hypothetical protein
MVRLYRVGVITSRKSGQLSSWFLRYLHFDGVFCGCRLTPPVGETSSDLRRWRDMGTRHRSVGEEFLAVMLAVGRQVTI